MNNFSPNTINEDDSKILLIAITYVQKGIDKDMDGTQVGTVVTIMSIFILVISYFVNSKFRNFIKNVYSYTAISVITLIMIIASLLCLKSEIKERNEFLGSEEYTAVVDIHDTSHAVFTNEDGKEIPIKMNSKAKDDTITVRAMQSGKIYVINDNNTFHYGIVFITILLVLYCGKRFNDLSNNYNYVNGILGRFTIAAVTALALMVFVLIESTIWAASDRISLKEVQAQIISEVNPEKAINDTSDIEPAESEGTEFADISFIYKGEIYTIYNSQVPSGSNKGDYITHHVMPDEVKKSTATLTAIIILSIFIQLLEISAAIRIISYICKEQRNHDFVN